MIAHNDALAKEIVERELRVKIYEPFCGIVLYEKDEQTGAVIVNNYDGHSCHFTSVHTGCMGMQTARQVARYIFRQLGCERVTAVTRTTNSKAISALEQLGFKLEGIMRRQFPDSDGMLCSASR
jgi:hypothetical protein